MAKYTIISDIGKCITTFLRDNLVPEPIDKAEKIGICEPKDRGDFILGIHPYDIREETSGQQREPIRLLDGRVQDPPAMLELYYMISVSSKAEITVKASEESRIIGKVIQIFKDNQIIPQRYMPDNTESEVQNIPISLLPIDTSEKVKIWAMFGESYKLSVFYVIGPVAIDSEVVRVPKKRVESIILGSTNYVARKIVQFETRIKDEEIEDDYTEPKDEDENSDDFGSEDEDSGNDDSEDENDLDTGDEDEVTDENNETPENGAPESESEESPDEDEVTDENNEISGNEAPESESEESPDEDEVTDENNETSGNEAPESESEESPEEDEVTDENNETSGNEAPESESEESPDEDEITDENNEISGNEAPGNKANEIPEEND